MTIVHVYIGVDPQVPTDYTLNLDPTATYQDLVTTFINMGGQSGQIYGINAEIINYDDPVTLPEVNYIISVGPYSTIYVRDLNGTLHRVVYSENGILRDVYNQVQVLGLGRNVRLVLQEEDVVSNNIGTNITFILSQGSKKITPTLIRGKQFPLDTLIRDLQLDQNKVFHLVKYHVGFKCSDE
jgi:hypothetical protein